VGGDRIQDSALPEISWSSQLERDPIGEARYSVGGQPRIRTETTVQPDPLPAGPSFPPDPGHGVLCSGVTAPSQGVEWDRILAYFPRGHAKRYMYRQVGGATTIPLDGFGAIPYQ